MGKIGQAAEAVVKAAGTVARGAGKSVKIPLTPEQRTQAKKVLGVTQSFATLPLPPSVVTKYGIVPIPPEGRSNLPPVMLKYGMPIMPPGTGRMPPPMTMKYGIMNPKADRMYLTPDQQRRIQNATGCKPCSYVEIEPGIRTLYGIPLSIR